MLNVIKSFKKVIFQLNKILTKKQKIKSFWIFITMILSSCMELLGVSIIVPFLELLTDSETLKTKWYISWLFDIVPDISMSSLLILMSVAFILVYLLKNAFMLFSTYVQASFSTEFSKDNSVRMLRSYMKRPYEFFTNTNSNIIFRGINGDINGTYKVLNNMYGLLSDCITILMIGIFLIAMDWMMALLALLLATGCLILVVAVFKNKMKEAGKISREASTAKGKISSQTVFGIKEITVMNRRELFVEAYEDASESERKTIITNTFISACPDRVIEAICISGFMLIVCIRMMSNEELSSFVPIIGTFAMGAFRILPSFAKISTKINNIVFDIPALNGCYENLIESERIENENLKIFLEKDKNNEKMEFKETLNIDDICWKYKNSDNVINHLSMSINKGESVAFIGPSGAGKTTLSDIILGLYKPQSGTVKMDDVDIFTIPNNWSRIVGYVPQSVFLIDDTVRNNVAFGIPLDNIDEDKVWRALKQAQLDEFVKTLPQGLDTIVGERGVKFSGGQRQRIAIARALYDDPDILILDEATSALDNETETAVMEAIDALQGLKTLIIVAHRLSTIRNCDTIYEINNGEAHRCDKNAVINNK